MKKRLWAAFVAGSVFVVMAGVASGKGDAGVIENGRKVAFNYTLTVDGKIVDSSEGHAPFEYTHGEGTIIPGLSKQLKGLKVGDEKNIVVAPKEAYGEMDPRAFQEVPKSRLPENLDLHVGTQLRANGEGGRVFIVTVLELKGDTVILNFNHPLAGKELHFQVKILSIQ